MIKDAPNSGEDGVTRAQVSALLRRLRGAASVADVARLLPPGSGSFREASSPQAWMELERGWHERRDPEGIGSGWQIANPTLQRLEELGHPLGVRFAVVAIDAVTGMLVDGQAPELAAAAAASPVRSTETEPWRQGRTRCARCGGRSVPANPDGSIATHKVLPYRGFVLAMPDGSVAVRCDGKGRLKGRDGRWVPVESATDDGEPA